MKKTTILAVLIFLALAAGTYLTLQQKPERGIQRISFAHIDKDTIDHIEITGPKPVELKKEGEIWKLGNGKEADENAVKRVVDTVPMVVSDQLVTSDPARFEELEVTPEKGSTVKVSASGLPMAEFTVGKGSGASANVRIGDAVYLVKPLYPSTYAKEASAWHQLKLFKDKIDDVTRVEVTLAGAAPYVLVKKEKEWELESTDGLPAGFRFDSSASRSLVSTLVNARAREILDTDPGVDKTGLGGELDVIAFVGKEDKRYELNLGDEGEEKKVYAQVGGKADIYTLADYTAKNLRKPVTELRSMTVMDFDKDQARKLTIRTADLQLVFEKQGADWKIAKSSEKIPDAFELDPAAVTRRVSAVASARAKGLATGITAAKAGLKKPSATVTVVLEDKRKVRIAFGDSFKDDKSDMVYIQGNADDEIYTANSWTMNNLTGGLDKFKKQPPAEMPNIDPSAMQNLPPDVRANLMKQLQQKQQQQEMMKRIQEQQAAGK